MKKRITHRLCIRGYANIVRGLAEAPATALELSARHDVTRAVMRALVKRLHAQRLIRICEWRQPTRGPATRVFGFGGHDDEPRPLTLVGKPSRHIGVSAPRPKPTLEVTSFGSLMRALSEERGVNELSEITGIGAHTVSRNLKHMRSIGLAYIAGWERRPTGTGGAPAPLYQLGIDRKDAPRPPRVSKQHTNATYNAARRARRLQMRVVHAICSNTSQRQMAPQEAQGMPPLPEPLRLTWKGERAAYYVNRPNVDSCDLYTAAQMHAYAQAYGDARAAAERERCANLRADADAIFNDPPSMTSQDVRDVIEWYDASIRAATQEGARG